jgi:hypothetical protein
MKTAAEYRAMAEECFEWAREAQTNEARASLRQAQIWACRGCKTDDLTPTRHNQRQTPCSSSADILGVQEAPCASCLPFAIDGDLNECRSNTP